ncbi:MAG: DUF1624 domain-containing protein [Candidatus Devosia euplotis]|nr:DUF1624 domain-containing protein [Candidatus Devosia euplotis]
MGVGLVLGHGRSVRWAAFWRRASFVVLGALAVTFGALHAIALFSLLALPFLFAPLWLTGLVAAVVIALPFVFSNAMFNQKLFSWIGFWQVPPPTNDLVPIFPWFAAVLIGIIATRAALGSSWAARLAAINPAGRLPRLLAQLGRWSLLIYLVHQPVLLA